jgi:glycosyltransferase involved in cell wall biosynthesis
MRIDLVITELDTGGAERCCAELAAFLATQGHEVRVLALGPRPVPPRSAIAEWLDQKQIQVEYLEGNSWLGFPSIAWRLRNAFINKKPEVVQSFLWHANVLVAAVLPFRDVPFFGGVRVAEPRSWRHPLSRWASKRMHRVVCVSEAIRDWCVQVERLDPQKLTVIPNGVRALEGATPELDVGSHRVPEGSPVLLFVGRLTEQKGVDILLMQVPRLMKRLPKHHLVLIGDGPLRRAADAVAANPDTGGRMHVLGRRDDVAAWMARSQLFVLPTRYEGMPNVLLEAMAAQRAVATLQVEGVAELLGSDLTAQSVPAGKWEAFLDLVVELAQDDEQREQLGQRNHDRVAEDFRLEVQLAKYEQLYPRSSGS